MLSTRIILTTLGFLLKCQIQGSIPSELSLLNKLTTSNLTSPIAVSPVPDLLHQQ
eukprot:gene3453-6865_t